MQANWRFGSLFGIPLYINSSWFLILALVTIFNAGNFNASGAFQGSSLFFGWIAGLVMALLLFGSVLLHELGHSLVAKAQGIHVNSITLFLFGGVAAIGRESNTPGKAFQVAIAGPVVSIALFGLFTVVTPLLSESSATQTLALNLARTNLVLGLFNLIPGLPLDGGQVLKAAIWKLNGDRFVGGRWASRTGQVLGWLAITLGLTGVLLTGQFSAVWIALIGWFVLRNASAYGRVTNLQAALLQLSAADAMTRELRIVDANMSLREFAEEYILSDTHTPNPYYAASDGRYRGLVRIEDLHSVERSEWENQTLHQIVHPLSEIPTVQENASLAEAINTLEESSEDRITVLSPADAVAGVIDRGDIVKAIASKEVLSVSEDEIKRIKTEGSYPEGVQLEAIAKTAIE